MSRDQERGQLVFELSLVVDGARWIQCSCVYVVYHSVYSFRETWLLRVSFDRGQRGVRDVDVDAVIVIAPPKSGPA